MDRAQLEQHQATLRGLRDTCNSIQRSGARPDVEYSVGFIDTLAAVVLALIDERIAVGEHAHAVAELIKRGEPVEPRMTLDVQGTTGGKATTSSTKP